jgi:hypothetical protein
LTALWRQQMLCDVQLRASNGEQLAAHSIVLASASGFFKYASPTHMSNASISVCGHAGSARPCYASPLSSRGRTGYNNATIQYQLQSSCRPLTGLALSHASCTGRAHCTAGLCCVVLGAACARAAWQQAATDSSSAAPAHAPAVQEAAMQAV